MRMWPAPFPKRVGSAYSCIPSHCGQVLPFPGCCPAAGGAGCVERLGSLLLKCCFTSTETVGLLGTGAQNVHLDFHTAPEL